MSAEEQRAFAMSETPLSDLYALEYAHLEEFVESLHIFEEDEPEFDETLLDIREHAARMDTLERFHLAYEQLSETHASAEAVQLSVGVVLEELMQSRLPEATKIGLAELIRDAADCYLD